MHSNEKKPNYAKIFAEKFKNLETKCDKTNLYQIRILLHTSQTILHKIPSPGNDAVIFLKFALTVLKYKFSNCKSFNHV